MLENRTQFFERALFESLGEQVEVEDFQFKSGGCINSAVKLSTKEGDYFIKWNENIDENMFEAEAKGLGLLQEAGDIYVPEIIGYGKIENKYYLILEYIDSRYPVSNYWEDFGSSLANLHRHHQEQYGLDHNNYIGKLPQNNEPTDTWIDFFVEKRLNVQLGLALYNKQVDDAFVKRFKSIYSKLPDILPEDPPSLLHGDMWSGNVMIGEDGKVCLIDPAVYYGHREMELAFTELFGGFDAEFYDAYNEAYPLQPGYHDRKDIYNLYPLMVHVNLFGASYLSGVEKIIKRYGA